MTHLMIDLETVGLSSNAGIIQIGAVSFDQNEITGIYHSLVSAESCERRGLTVDKDTLSWWNRQDPELRKYVFSGTKDIAEVLEEFLSGFPDARQYQVWSNGADFDLPIIKNALEVCGFRYPFDFRKHRCFRTLKALVPPVVYLEVPPNTKPHDALQDAMHQTHVTQACLRYLECLHI